MYITAEQRKLVHAFVRDIAEFRKESAVSLMNDLKETYKRIMDDEGFTLKSEESTAERKCTVLEYQDFMDWILEIAFEIGYQSKTRPVVYFEDTERYLVICIKYRICCISGNPGADIHHGVDKDGNAGTVGMGQNRTKVDHSKRPRLPLSRYYHQLAHTIGNEKFNEMYHVFGVYVPYWNDVKDGLDESEE